MHLRLINHGDRLQHGTIQCVLLPDCSSVFVLDPLMSLCITYLYLSICLSVCTSVSILQPVCIFLYVLLSVCPYVCGSVCLCFRLCFCLCLFLLFLLSVCASFFFVSALSSVCLCCCLS